MLDIAIVIVYILIIIGSYFLFVRTIRKESGQEPGFYAKVISGFAATCVPHTLVNGVIYGIKAVLWIIAL